jgi:hypothetical protein
MERTTAAAVAALMLMASACISVRQVGGVNMVSTRNVDPKLDYKPLATYSGGSQSELKASQAKTIDDAVNATVRRVPGGEFLMNVKFYLVDEKYFAVEGDVWGAADQAYRGFRVGDRVTIKNPAFFTTQAFLLGTIASLKSTEVCLVKPDGPNEKLIEVSYDDVTKSSGTPLPAEPTR